MNGLRWIKAFKPTCCFIEGGLEQPCHKPAVGAYITADHLEKARWVCTDHARKAEREGDGPVLYPRRKRS